MKKVNLNLLRKDMLLESKKYIVQEGWNEKLLQSIAKNKKFKIDEILLLFPDGESSLLNFYMEELNEKMTQFSKKLKLPQMRTHERVREIILLRLKVNLKEKKILKKTYYYLLLPQNYKILLKNLYKTVDQIWFIAEDKSYDFNFYTKRMILASIYSATILHWINNEDFELTERFLDKKLKLVSKIPQFKSKTKNLFGFITKKIKTKNFA